MKILPDPADGQHDLFDGGRRIGPGKSERFVLKNLVPGRAAHVLVRTAPDREAHVMLRVGGQPLVELVMDRAEGWAEAVAPVPPERLTGPEMAVEMFNQGPGDFVDYHAWVTQSARLGSQPEVAR